MDSKEKGEKSPTLKRIREVKMTNAEIVKEAGFKSVKEFAGLINVTPRTVQNWSPELVEFYVIFAKIRKEMQKNSEKAKIILAMLS